MLIRLSKPASFPGSAHIGSPLLGYSVALALALVCAAARLGFGLQSQAAPFLFFYVGIALAAFIGGMGPGLAVMLGAGVFGAFALPEVPATANWIVLAVLGVICTYGFARLRLLRDRTAAVAEDAARLRFVMERVSDWLFLVDERGFIRYANQSACAQLGFTQEELLDRPVAELEAESQNCALAKLVKQSKDGGTAPAEIVLKRSDGSQVTAEVSCTAIRTGGALVVHVAARDITDRKQLDQKLREAQQWESLGALTGGLAHDFNNLLTAIMGNASLAREMLPAHDPTAALLGAVESAGERCAELIRLMLATSGYRAHNLETLCIDRMAHEAAAARGLPQAVHIEVEADPCEFVSDPATMDTLLRALITNAAESYGTGPGKVVVSVHSGPLPSLAKGSFQEGVPMDFDYIGIVVEDHGCGMTREVAERAFNPFFTTKFTGRGLGLPAVRGIVRAHDGILWMRTGPGAGTRVEVWLPTASYHQSASAGAPV